MSVLEDTELVSYQSYIHGKMSSPEDLAGCLMGLSKSQIKTVRFSGSCSIFITSYFIAEYNKWCFSAFCYTTSAEF